MAMDQSKQALVLHVCFGEQSNYKFVMVFKPRTCAASSRNKVSNLPLTVFRRKLEPAVFNVHKTAFADLIILVRAFCPLFDSVSTCGQCLMTSSIEDEGSRWSQDMNSLIRCNRLQSSVALESYSFLNLWNRLERWTGERNSTDSLQLSPNTITSWTVKPEIESNLAAILATAAFDDASTSPSFKDATIAANVFVLP